MAKAESSYFAGTTRHAVVLRARSYQDLIEKLYRFGLERSAGLPKQAGLGALNDAVAELIARLMEATEAAHAAEPGRDRKSCAEDILRRLRKPGPRARLHKKSGFRWRIKQAILRQLGERRPLSLEEPASLAAPPDEEEEPPPIEPAPQLLTRVSEALNQAWDQALETTRQEICKQPKSKIRRGAILSYLAERAREHTRTGVVADHLESVLDSTRAAAVIKALRERGVVGLRGRRAVSDGALRKDVKLVEDALRRRLDELRETERLLRTELVIRSAGDHLKELLRQRSDAPREASS